MVLFTVVTQVAKFVVLFVLCNDAVQPVMCEYELCNEMYEDETSREDNIVEYGGTSEYGR